MKRISVLLAALCSLSVWAQDIRLNQIGFYPDCEKIAVFVNCPDKKFEVKSLDGNVVYSGKLSAEQLWVPSGEKVKIANFSEFDEEGKYIITSKSFKDSYQFEIDDEVLHEALRGSVKGFYFQRASMPLDKEYAGKWHRPEGHPDTEVVVHESAESGSVPAGTKISSPKGWYDAGDFGKYIVNSGISCYSMLMAYEQFPELFNDLKTNIPESENELPDLLDEVKYNLDWMFTMQINAPGTEEDGSVYHKLTTKNFEGHIMPHTATMTRYVIGRNTEDALNFAAVMAQASRVYKPFDAAYSKKCIDAAIKAWNWAYKNNTGAYTNPSDIKTGEYGNSKIESNYQWAALELSLTTKDKRYFNQHSYDLNTVSGQWWGDARALGLNTLVHHIDDQDFFTKEEIEKAVLKLCKPYVEEYQESPYKVVMGQGGKGDFIWGSNSVAMNQSISLIAAYQLTKEEKYLKAALSNVDYVLGRNAVDFCFLTGFGDKPTMDIHHRHSHADDVEDPAPGLLAGGPNWEKQDNCPGYEGDTPAKSYCDNICSYASNEIAINWNSPLVYVLGAVEHYCD